MVRGGRRRPAVTRRRDGCRCARGGPPRTRRWRRLVEQVADLVGPRQQHPLGEGIDVEGQVLVTGQVDQLLLQVDPQLDVGLGRHEVEQLAVALGLDDDRQEAVLQGVVAEDVGEAVEMTARKPHCGERPGSVLARQPQPKLSPASRICRALRLGLVEDEVGRGCPSAS